MQVCCPICETEIECKTVLITDSGVLCPNCNTMVDLQQLVAGNSLSFSADGFDKDRTWSMAAESNQLTEGGYVGKFRILREVGRGGFGTVYKALDEQLKRVVALKIPREDARSQMNAAAFLREAQMAASVRDPNIVVVHEVGTDRDRMYICSDFIHGVTLREWMRQRERSIEEACTMIVRIARSLHRAHESGLVHRDLKPANILIDREGNPFITDFGLARRTLKGADGVESIRMEIVGTPGYMSPEQAVGEMSAIGPPSDCYALGVMLYELVSKHRPFSGDISTVLGGTLHEDPPPPSSWGVEIPKPLEAIVLKSLAKAVPDRYASAAAFADDLERFLRREPTEAAPLTRWEYVGYKLRQHRRVLASAALLGVAVGITWWASVSVFRQTPVVVERVVDVPQPTVPVSVVTVPARANVAIVPVDPNTRKPMRERMIQPDRLTPMEVDLPEGEYVIEAYLPGLGVQEVRRSVSIDDLPSGTSGTAVALAPIKIRPVPEEMVFVQGGDFHVAYDGEGRVTQPYHVPDFYVQPTEVTCQQYSAVMGVMPKAFDSLNRSQWYEDSPVSRFTLGEALEYAERIGGRLIDYEEYCFLATNRGTTNVPWGDLDAEQLSENCWKIAPVRHYAFDQTLPGTADAPIFGLFSNVPELTGTTIVSDFLVQAGVRGQQDSLVIVGQPLSLMGLVPTPPQLPLQARQFGSKSIEGFFALPYPIGFRCARSATPRFLDLDEVAP